ncbi:hypothetical protein J2S00_002707 [Caldalkalibacillus uzonensis]|uniref:Homing endonuclease LAGLIDADG domain-containing protein n=1 Tax=Caldalkalibacillus uzonensis TaxID=353224 RepID=A0ABU0CUV3_9BACI|nr:hypothetical protein [Caldalkalibacillus uzonensis]MDQ0339912.1 hypothetical protein [Caldalkalibacillus uzonensis]
MPIGGRIPILKLSKKEINYALFGLVLGDGSYRKGIIKVSYSNKQRFYVEWLEGLCKALGLKHTASYEFYTKTTFGKRLYSHINIWVPDRRHFEKYNRVYNNSGRKIPSKYVLRRINPLGLLLWYLDDGQLHVSFKGTKAKRFAYLNTQSFTLAENKRIQQMFKERFDIDLSIHTDNSGFSNHKGKIYYRLYFNATNFRKFYDIVRPYLHLIPEEFSYKFNMQYRPNRLKTSAEYAASKYNGN